MSSMIVEGSNLEVLDLIYDDDDSTTLTAAHNHTLVSRYDDATHDHGHEPPTPMHEPKHKHSDQVNIKKRSRSDSIRDKDIGGSSSKKRRIITGGHNGCFTTPVKSSANQPATSSSRAKSFSTRRFKAPRTPPPTRKSRTQHKKHVASVMKAPRGPSRHVLAARAAALSSSPEPGPKGIVVISDNDTPPSSASRDLQQAVESAPSSISSISSSVHGFWDEPIPFPAIERSQQTFRAGLEAFATAPQLGDGAVLPSTETQHTRSSDEDYFIPASPLLPSPLAPDLDFESHTSPATAADVTFPYISGAGDPAPAFARGVPTLAPAAFRHLQNTSAKLTFDNLPPLPHHLTHPPNTDVLIEMVREVPGIMQRFEERWDEKFRDVREEIDFLAQFMDEDREVMRAAVQVD